LPDRELEGRVALVTGGSRGIGAAVCAELARAGAEVVVNYTTNAEAAEAVRAAIGDRAHAIRGDISTSDGATGLVDQVESDVGPIAILVNNAGITRDNLIMKLAEEDWRDVIDTNLGGAFFTSRAVARPMLKRRAGSIVNMSSVVGVHGNAGQTNYAASKAGIIGFTKSLARELGSRGVRANVVAPGYITSRLTDEISDEMRSLMLQNTPLGRLGDPENVAGAVRFLCSDEAGFITGEVLLVDGGLGM